MDLRATKSTRSAVLLWCNPGAHQRTVKTLGKKFYLRDVSGRLVYSRGNAAKPLLPLDVPLGSGADQP